MQNKIINGFTIKRFLGVGGMAEVWYAENRLGKAAAVKVLLRKYCDDQRVVARFENEAKVMLRLEHPHIGEVYDYGEIDGRPAIIMEYLDGKDLKTRMKEGQRFTQEELERWWNQLVEALNYTHAKGIVHRDIKPSNIFIDKEGNVRLLDFGIAKSSAIELTLTGSNLGTRLYMSPEQVRDPKRVDYRSDSYSLAVTFVHLLTGKAPYDIDSSSDYEILDGILHKPVDLSGVPANWRGFLQPYLAKDPDERPDLSFYLMPSDDEETLPGTPELLPDEETIPDEEKNAKKKAGVQQSPKKPLWMVLALIVVAVIVCVFLFIRGPYEKPDRWIAESESIHVTCHIDASREDYTKLIDSLNLGYNYIEEARKNLKAMRDLDSLALLPRLRLCDSMQGLYVNDVATIVEKELVSLSIMDDTLAALTRLRQLTKFDYLKRDSTGILMLEKLENDIDFLCHADLSVVRIKGRYVFVRQPDNTIIDVIDSCYSRVDALSEGLSIVRVNDKIGFINKFGDIVIQPQYDEAESFSEGLAKVKIGGKYGFIDKTGEVVIEPRYDDATSFSDHYAVVRSNDKEYFIDQGGEVAIKSEYDKVWGFSDGRACVVLGNHYGFINTSGDTIVALKYFGADRFSEGLAAVQVDDMKTGKWGYIDKEGHVIITPRFERAGLFSEGLAAVMMNDKWGFVDSSGQEVVRPQYDDVSDFSEGLAVVKTGGKYGYIDKKGTMVIRPQYVTAFGFSHRLAKVMDEKDDWKYLDKQGRVVFEDVAFEDLVVEVNGVNMLMKFVHGGSFHMGWKITGDYSYYSELPVHRVELSSYYIGETEVTQELWEAVMDSNPSRWKGKRLPIDNVSWDDCQVFISKLNEITGKDFRMPTEAEWEYAARGGCRSKGTKYPGSSKISEVAWYFNYARKENKTHEVKCKLPNELGLYDMSGNVSEWCSDWYFYYFSVSETNPTDPLRSYSYPKDSRVTRGGSYDHGSGGCLVYCRDGMDHAYSDSYTGFRLVLSK